MDSIKQEIQSVWLKTHWRQILVQQQQDAIIWKVKFTDEIRLKGKIFWSLASSYITKF